jgi:hypothetical protein
MLRCRECHFVRSWFRGWSFTTAHCRGIQDDSTTRGANAMLHDWELLDETAPELGGQTHP